MISINHRSIYIRLCSLYGLLSGPRSCYRVCVWEGRGAPTGHQTSIGSMFGQRRRRWPNIDPTLGALRLLGQAYLINSPACDLLHLVNMNYTRPPVDRAGQKVATSYPDNCARLFEGGGGDVGMRVACIYLSLVTLLTLR